MFAQGTDVHACVLCQGETVRVRPCRRGTLLSIQPNGICKHGEDCKLQDIPLPAALEADPKTCGQSSPIAVSRDASVWISRGNRKEQVVTFGSSQGDILLRH